MPRRFSVFTRCSARKGHCYAMAVNENIFFFFFQCQTIAMFPITIIITSNTLKMLNYLLLSTSVFLDCSAAN